MPRIYKFLTDNEDYIKSKIIINSDTDCWEWQGCIGPEGYGRSCWRGVQENAHRVSFRVFKGGIKKGNFICHTCDNMICVNPDHLYSGTQKDNMKDKRLRKRSAVENNYGAKLNWDDVNWIRSKKGILMTKELADIYGVTPTSISSILNNRTWVV
jgi:hypothetical protein